MNRTLPMLALLATADIPEPSATLETAGAYRGSWSQYEAPVDRSRCGVLGPCRRPEKEPPPGRAKTKAARKARRKSRAK